MSGVWAARERNTRWDPVIRAAQVYPYKTTHVAGIVDDEATAWEAARGIYSARRHFGVGAKTWVEQTDDGRHRVMLILFDLEEARRHIAEKVARGEKLSYNVLRNYKPKKKRS